MFVTFLVYRQIVGIPRGTYSTSLGAELFLFCYESDFMFSLSDNTKADIFEAFNFTSRNIDYANIEQMASQIYPTYVQLKNKNKFFIY